MLVKIEKEKTKNPKPISKSTMLVNRASEEDIDKNTKRKGDLLARLNKVKQEKPGSTKGMSCYEKQPTVLRQKLRIDFEL